MKYVLALLAMIPLPASAQARSYVEGQVWAYKTRPGDDGSLLKIQKIETDKRGRPIYHISVIGFHLSDPHYAPILPHEPVSQQSLDESVTELKADPGTFPSADSGIAEWRSANGGVYTISIAKTIDVLDQTLRK
ncbi:MAG: hypothetical protein J0I47_12085 [Sphingomonas sp.]|uniref:hypothetical protein n=1 Tax=Sphingomonas sp. TaxID=28214 RepID=UPI001AC395D3|nr:hypothetical protein [Sphingomonas sp.]MBN8808954.1 hypothetical protein [Sphingomonas sp.]